MSYEKWNMNHKMTQFSNWRRYNKLCYLAIGGIKMQNNTEVFPYERIKKVQKEEKKNIVNMEYVIKSAIYLISGFFISRVVFISPTSKALDNLAPFGLSFLIAVIGMKEDKNHLYVAFGSILGYLSIFYLVNNIGNYIISIAVLVLISYSLKSVNKRLLIVIEFVSVFLVLFAFRLVLNKYGTGFSLFISFLEVSSIVPLYYIFNYSIVCFTSIKTRHLFSNEEIICMAAVIAIAISGIQGLNIYGVSIRNIIALCLVFILGYINGSSVGASVGVAMGAVIGISSQSVIAYIGIYAICGLVSGMFKDIGKIVCVLSFVMVFTLIKIYTNVSVDFKIMEAVISGFICICISNNFYGRLQLELDFEKKHKFLNEKYGNKVKNMFILRLNSFSDVLFNMAHTLNGLVDNEKLSMNNKASSLIESLADRVCSDCSMNMVCWKREINSTYGAFGELIQNFQDRKNIIPEEIERKCIKRTNLTHNTEDIVKNFIINEMWKERVSEGREMLSKQINSMGNSVKEIVDEFDNNIIFDNIIEDSLRVIFDKKKIKYSDIICIKDKNSKLIIKMTLNACGGEEICVKKILPLINESLNRCMCISDDGCHVDTKYGTCNISFEETPKYYVASYAKTKCMNGEKYNGDSHYFGKLNDGTYLTIISDGMGTGPEAGQESSAAVELIQRFTKAGFSKITAINTVNSLMTFKFAEDEKFSTVDLSSVDLYNGEVNFMKVGAVDSFIKSNKRVEIIKSKTLPIGVLDKVDVDIINRQVKNGDFIIMVTDGIVDYNSDSANNGVWLEGFLERINSNNPEEIADAILTKAIELAGGMVNDDMTVIVSKIYSVF